jgi:glutathione peroxidase
MTTAFDFDAVAIDGQPLHLKDLAGKALLVVNTASACGFTPQFAGLEALHQKYGSQGLVVLGFPCNQFGAQDKGSDGEIANFCQKNYGVSFTMMSKVNVNGADAHPLFQWLTKEAPGILGTQAIKWNFTKFLVGPDGLVRKRYAPTDTPASLEGDIEAVLPAAIVHGGVAFALPGGELGMAIAGAGEKGKEGEAHVALSVDGGLSWSATTALVKMVKK